MNGPFPAPRAEREDARRRLGPALFGGAFGGALLAAVALGTELGWLAALAAYCVGGSLLMVALSLLPLLEVTPVQPALRPAYARVRRRP
jgi:hypothetical protein